MPVPAHPALTPFIEPGPNRGQEEAEFDTNQQNFVNSQFNNVTEQNALAEWMKDTADFAEEKANNAESQAQAAAESADDAQTSAALAAATANNRGEWSLLSGPAARPFSVTHLGDVYILQQDMANVASVEPGTNPAYWFNYTAANAGYINPLTTKGDMIVGGTSGVQERLGAPTTATKAYLLRYDVDTQTVMWEDEEDYLGGGANNVLPGNAIGNVATSSSQTVTLDCSVDNIWQMSMNGANTTGTLTIALTNFPTTTSGVYVGHIFLVRGGRKTVSITVPGGLTFSWTQGAAPYFTDTSGQFDCITFEKKFSSTVVDAAINNTGGY